MRNNSFNNIFFIISILISLVCVLMGILFLTSGFFRDAMPSKTIANVLGIGWILYGLFRTWMNINKFKAKNESE